MSPQHAIFNSLIHNLRGTPLEQTEYTEGYKHTLKIAKLNGFDKQINRQENYIQKA